MGIHTSPSGLESTCLVFVHGLGEYITDISDAFSVINCSLH